MDCSVSGTVTDCLDWVCVIQKIQAKAWSLRPKPKRGNLVRAPMTDDHNMTKWYLGNSPNLHE